jgi:hypothetical protein
MLRWRVKLNVRPLKLNEFKIRPVIRIATPFQPITATSGGAEISIDMTFQVIFNVTQW